MNNKVIRLKEKTSIKCFALHVGLARFACSRHTLLYFVCLSAFSNKKGNLNKSVDWLTISPGSSLIKISFPKVAEIGFSF